MNKRRKKPLLPWLSGQPDNDEKQFIQVGYTLLMSPAFQSLNAGTRCLYFCMAMNSKGKREYEFNQSTAKRFGFAPKSFWTYVNELKANGFIIRNSMRNLRKSNKYSFSFAWKGIEPPASSA